MLRAPWSGHAAASRPWRRKKDIARPGDADHPPPGADGQAGLADRRPLWLTIGPTKRTACRIDSVCKAVITAFQVLDLCGGETEHPASMERLPDGFRHHESVVLKIDGICNTHHGSPHENGCHVCQRNALAACGGNLVHVVLEHLPDVQTVIAVPIFHQGVIGSVNPLEFREGFVMTPATHPHPQHRLENSLFSFSGDLPDLIDLES